MASSEPSDKSFIEAHHEMAQQQVKLAEKYCRLQEGARAPFREEQANLKGESDKLNAELRDKQEQGVRLDDQIRRLQEQARWARQDRDDISQKLRVIHNKIDESQNQEKLAVGPLECALRKELEGLSLGWPSTAWSEPPQDNVNTTKTGPCSPSVQKDLSRAEQDASLLGLAGKVSQGLPSEPAQVRQEENHHEPESVVDPRISPPSPFVPRASEPIAPPTPIAKPNARKTAPGGDQLSPKRPRMERSVCFDDVFQDGKADERQIIVQFPSDTGDWYVLKCFPCRKSFPSKPQASPFQGAIMHIYAIHAGKKKKKVTHKDVINKFGVRVHDCDTEKADRNNAAFMHAQAEYDRAIAHASAGLGATTSKRHSSLKRPPASAREASDAPGSSAESSRDLTADPCALGQDSTGNPLTSIRSGLRKTFKGVVDPVDGEIYQAYWRPRWFAVVVLPRGDFGHIGISGKLSATGLMDDPEVPKCYDYDKLERHISGFKDQYKDGGAHVRRRYYPCMFLEDRLKVPAKGTFDIRDIIDAQVLGWVPVKDLRPYDPCKPDTAESPDLVGNSSALQWKDRLSKLGIRPELRQQPVPDEQPGPPESAPDADFIDLTGLEDDVDEDMDGDSFPDVLVPRDSSTTTMPEPETKTRSSPEADLQLLNVPVADANNGDTCPNSIGADNIEAAEPPGIVPRSDIDQVPPDPQVADAMPCRLQGNGQDAVQDVPRIQNTLVPEAHSPATAVVQSAGISVPQTTPTNGSATNDNAESTQPRAPVAPMAFPLEKIARRKRITGQKQQWIVSLELPEAYEQQAQLFHEAVAGRSNVALAQELYSRNPSGRESGPQQAYSGAQGVLPSVIPCSSGSESRTEPIQQILSGPQWAYSDPTRPNDPPRPSPTVPQPQSASSAGYGGAVTWDYSMVNNSTIPDSRSPTAAQNIGGGQPYRFPPPPIAASPLPSPVHPPTPTDRVQNPQQTASNRPYTGFSPAGVWHPLTIPIPSPTGHFDKSGGPAPNDTATIPRPRFDGLPIMAQPISLPAAPTAQEPVPLKDQPRVPTHGTGSHTGDRSPAPTQGGVGNSMTSTASPSTANPPGSKHAHTGTQIPWGYRQPVEQPPGPFPSQRLESSNTVHIKQEYADEPRWRGR